MEAIGSEVLTSESFLSALAQNDADFFDGRNFQEIYKIAQTIILDGTTTGRLTFVDQEGNLVSLLCSNENCLVLKKHEQLYEAEWKARILECGGVFSVSAKLLLHVHTATSILLRLQRVRDDVGRICNDLLFALHCLLPFGRKPPSKPHE